VRGRTVLLPERLARRLATWIEAEGLTGRVVTLPGEGEATVPWERITGAVLWSWEPARLARLLLERCPNLRWLHSTWAGVDHLPLEAIRTRRIVLTNSRGVVAGPLAEWVVAAVLWGVKRLRRLERQQRERAWRPVLDAGELAGATALVLGTGAIGTAVARRLAPFGLRLVGVNTTGRPRRPFHETLPASALPAAARGAHLLVAALPSSPATRCLVDRRLLAALADGAGVINVGRGDTVDLEALAEEVASGRLWAALDVFPEEPLPPASPLWSLEGVLVSPHSAHASPRHRERHLELVRDLLRRHLEGRRLRNVVRLRGGGG